MSKRVKESEGQPIEVQESLAHFGDAYTNSRLACELIERFVALFWRGKDEQFPPTVGVEEALVEALRRSAYERKRRGAPIEVLEEKGILSDLLVLVLKRAIETSDGTFLRDLALAAERVRMPADSARMGVITLHSVIEAYSIFGTVFGLPVFRKRLTIAQWSKLIEVRGKLKPVDEGQVRRMLKQMGIPYSVRKRGRKKKH